jgi:hypothetical protein
MADEVFEESYSAVVLVRSADSSGAKASEFKSNFSELVADFFFSLGGKRISIR